ncbi:lysophospholipid acyltransferase family protein [Chitinibacter bivalviorum]|uniref:Lysophospholipid acyltransferase family protein n=1 Tax=Chitinibacter bivalviorum TaxID=2739434 RepID=A0A7H9BL63_9NEIS|nr:lysophospholipid acyltransferase family protein [Chitinibacter bivalviorum]QLG89417.1 lysophospholipid acyltransferase family protein [Chitinibacter bivalviorum]
MLLTLSKLIAKLPLPLLQALGWVVGWLVWWGSPRHRRVLRTNLKISAIAKNSSDYNRLIKSSIPELGVAALEFLPHWMRPIDDLLKLVKEKRGWEHVEAALATDRPIIFMSPHLGALEMTGVCVAGLIPRKLAPLYRPPKQAYLEPLMIYSRSRGGAEPAPANASGVRVLLKTLKQGGVAYLLPDQVPGGGEGVWAPFFGDPAYTMSLLTKMAKASNAIILPCYTERLGIGRGYRFHVQPFVGELNGDAEHDATLLNQNVEDLIRQIPEQYFWSYSRYKHPAGAPLPPGAQV